MRLPDLTPVKVGDVTFLIKMSWGRYRKLCSEQAALPDDDSEAGIDFMENALREVVKGSRGLLDETGQEVVWTPDIINELPPSVIKELASSVFSIGDAENPTTPEATSPEQPAS
jgi:hypothetical protein